LKTIEDIKVVNGIAVLEGVSFAEEANVVDMFLKTHTKIKYASVVTNDQRSFALINGKLTLSKDKTFVNPYYVEKSIEIESKKELPELNNVQSHMMNKNLEQRVEELEEKVSKLCNLLLKVTQISSEYIK
jgi:hypothetical protein